ncbi:CocE/NonD family hydrolase [Puia sp. P3]|uniref:CocE/NonD family hydrolase n=1 Tax=Puia sp. P3 TaxID=3423952 RepID=UPI003D6714DE
MKILFLFAALMPLWSCGQTSNYVKDNYEKREAYIPMRDGKRLYTAIYIPKDHSQRWPFLMERTPYSSGPYGDTLYPGSLGPSRRLMEGRFIFVYQDVRGRFMSEGDFQEMTPAINKKKARRPTKARIHGILSTGC